MGLIQKALDLVAGRHTEETLKHIENIEKQQEEVEHDIAEIREHTDRLYRLILEMKHPPENDNV